MAPAWRQRENERLAESAAAYAANPEPKLARNRQWHAENPPRERNPEGRRKDRVAHRMRRRQAFVEHVDRLVVLERDDGICGICGRDVDPMEFDVDHIVALAMGGRHAYDNVQAAHPSCNRSKGSR